MSGATVEGLYAFDAGSARRYDPAFKLFGRTIPVLSVANRKRKCGEEKNVEESAIVSTEESNARSCLQDVGDEAPESEDQSLGTPALDELGSSAGTNDGCKEEKPNEGIKNNFDIPCSDVSVVSGVDVPIEGNDGDTRTTELDDGGAEIQDAVPKKPEKPVPCPRCDSLDTKFCYFNNYNVNQPRHFCKNCQRYWTAGGTLRNVPVGAGRRKSKHTGSQHRNMPPDALVVRRDSSDSAQQLLSCPGSSPVGMSKHLKMGPSPSRLHLQSLDVCSLAALDSPSSSTILNFGQESPFCESIGTTSYSPHAAEVLTGYKSEVTQGRFSRTTYVPSEADVGLSSRQTEEDSKSPNENQIHGQSSASDVSHETDAPTQSTSRPVATVQPLVQPSVEPKGDPPTLTDQPGIVDTSLGWGTGAPLAFVGGPWQYGGIVGWSDTSLATSMSTALSPNSNITGANPQATVSVSHPPWGGAIGSLWGGVPWPFIPSPIWGPQFWGGAWTVPWAAGAAAAANSVLGSPTLGKRPLGQEESNTMEKGGSLWVPKTLRIDDPGEAARSSIWMALGLDDRSEPKTSGGIFSRLQTKTESKEAGNSPIHAWHSNPAAMTRSMAFQESGLVSSKNTDVQGV